MYSIKKSAKMYLSTNILLEIFTIEGSDGLRFKFIDLSTLRKLTLWCDEVASLIKQIINHEEMNVRHPYSWRELICNTFSIKRIFNSPKYILMKKYHQKIILDKLAIKNLILMDKHLDRLRDTFGAKIRYDLNYKQLFAE